MRMPARRRPTPLAALAAALLAAAAAAAPPDRQPVAPARPRGVPVQVVNDDATPVPVVSTGPSEVQVLSLPAVQALLLPSKQPFQRGFYIEVPAGGSTAGTEFEVPAGKRLVLEWVGGSTRVSGWENVRLVLSTTASGATVGHDVATNGYRRDFAGSSPPLNPDLQVRFGQVVKLYADPGTSVVVQALRSETLEITPTGFAVSVSGYLVDCGDDPACPIP